MREFTAAHPEADVRIVAADLATQDGIDTVARICADEPLDLLINNAGVSHYMPWPTCRPTRRANWSMSKSSLPPSSCALLWVRCSAAAPVPSSTSPG
ncbi:hypothetical protein [Streptomyces sp. NPDC006739]|uniref:hypothetical protein n=1 Tax=Streptomyces sp. NPDC006739 TaxID=3364763 RepID=UPI0036CE6E32